MSQYFVNVSFKLNDGKLEDWKVLSTQINEDIAKAKGFISRDSGIDEQENVYCLVKWESQADQEAFLASLMAREDSAEMMAHFGSIVDMATMSNRGIQLF